MDTPLRITYHNVTKTAELESLIQYQTTKLERICDYMTSCKVTLEKPHEHPNSGNAYLVKIDMKIPQGHDIAIKHGLEKEEMHTPLDTVIRNAFGSARMELESLTDIQHKEVKTHHPTPDEIELDILEDQADELLEDEWLSGTPKRKIN